MHRNDVIALCSMLIGVASLATDAAFGGALNALVPGHVATEALAGLAIAGMVASQIMRVLSVPAGSPPAVNPPPAAPPQNGT